MAVSSRKSASRVRTRARFLVRPLFAALVASGIVAPAQGATVAVTNGGDAGTAATCTLRQALDSINAAAALPGCVASTTGSFGSTDAVDLSAQFGTIALAGATALTISVPVQINGPGAAALTISGANASRVFEAGGLVGMLKVSQVTVANGSSLGPGGCIYAVPPTTVLLAAAVVTGCKAQDDPAFPGTPFNALGGGVFAYGVIAEYSTISGNTAQTAGGGVAAGFVEMYRTLVTGNTVLGESIDITGLNPGNKYSYQTAVLATAALGGGGVAATGSANLAYSVVSDNTVHATTFFGSRMVDGQTYNFQYRAGTGGGISSLPFLKYYGPPDNLSAQAERGKSMTIAGVRSLMPRPSAAKAAQFRALAQKHMSAAHLKSALRKPKADGSSGSLGLWASTISGNQILGAGSVPGNTQLLAKYAGGGAAFVSEGYNAEFANSTVSGNRIPTNGFCSPQSGPPGGNVYRISCGAGLFGDSAELTNSTIAGNTGPTAVEFKYELPVGFGTLSAKAATVVDAHPRLQRTLAQLQAKRANVRAATKASMKASSPPILDSTIVAGNTGVYDIGCIDTGSGCTLGGSNNLVRSAAFNVTLPGGTLSSLPNLAPLADNGGLLAGAPGAAGTTVPRTHALYTGSPAIDAGSNIEGFAYDQRGPSFPRTTGGGTDIGAFEGSIAAPPNLQAKPVPALGAWMLGALSALLGMLGLARRRKRA